jgi:exosortase A-associated hydrolase 1/exosortase A-associated hydrolase 2
MSPARPIVQQAGFVSAEGGPRFRIVTRPREGECLGTVIWVHAFAEEMNKTRRMSARMARLLAANGWRVVQRDLRGCGDSAGDFGDASWAAWIDDVDAELQQADPERPVWLWCVRAGALLASAVIAGRPQVNLLLWQPVLSGAQHLQQFLRLHAASRLLGSAKGASDPSPAQALRNGLVVEIGGYILAPSLARGLEQASFDAPADFSGRVVWLELWQDAAPTVSVAGARLVERLLARGIDVAADALAGPPFWQTLELEESEPLLQRSLAALVPHAPALSLGAFALSAEPAAQAERIDPTNDASPVEQALGFRCGDELMWGVLSRPAAAAESASAVVIAVGGPQYRVGSHRQFVLLARRLAEEGYPSLRFDYRGMGDSEGGPRGFEDIEPDMRAAIEALRRASGEREVVVWGLCDAASAAMMHASLHPGVAGIVAVNPWARSAASLAAVHVRHYYLARALQRDFWANLALGRLDVGAALVGLLGNIRRTLGYRWSARSRSGDGSYQSKMARGVAAFRGRVLLVVAGNDLTAKEFLQHAEVAPAWRGVLESHKVSRIDLPQADHTFSSRVWRRRVEDATIAWLRGNDRQESS